MATLAATQAVLGVDQGSPKIIRQDIGASSTVNYVLGATYAPGKARYIVTTTSDNDATQAAAIQTGLRL